MSPPGVESAIQRPLDVVGGVFREHAASAPLTNGSFAQTAHIRDTPTALPGKVSAAFEQILNTKEAQDMIPSLNTADMNVLQPNSLVRFSCMIQDMHSPEYYLGVYEASDPQQATGDAQLVTGLYRDAVYGDNVKTADDMPPFERLPLYCVPIPGETGWVKDWRRETTPQAVQPRVASPSASASRKKRGLDDADGEGQQPTMMDAPPTPNGTVDRDGMPTSNTASESPAVKAQKTDTAKARGSAARNPFNHPLPGETGTTALVKMYTPDANDLKMGDCIEVVGVLARDPAINAFAPSFDGEVNHSAASAVPRLHAISFRKLDTLHPVIATTPVPDREGVLAEVRAVLPKVRDAVINQIAAALGGDKFASEYVLLNLMSRIYTRTTDLCLGNFSVNLTKVSEVTAVSGAPVTATLPATLEALVPAFHTLPLSFETLKTFLFGPSKDYQTETLRSGRLQLAAGTHVIVDETCLTEGKLEGVPVLQLGTLRRVLSQQVLEYDFQFHKMEFPVDIPIIVVSQGKSGILPCSAVVPIVPDTGFATPSPLSPEDLNMCRTYLGLCRLIGHTVDDSAAQVAEQSFVEARQKDDKVTPETFAQWLVMARLLSLSHGEAALTPDRWRQVLDMEHARAERVKK